MKITRQQMMAFFRSEDFDFEMSSDDRVEIFIGVLKGSSDLNIKLLNELCDNYDVSLQAVLNGWHLETEEGA